MVVRCGRLRHRGRTRRAALKGGPDLAGRGAGGRATKSGTFAALEGRALQVHSERVASWRPSSLPDTGHRRTPANGQTATSGDVATRESVRLAALKERICLRGLCGHGLDLVHTSRRERPLYQERSRGTLRRIAFDKLSR